MITDELTKELALHIKANLGMSGVEVFKNDKKVDYKGEYIVVNCLPVSFGSYLNSSGELNVNIHVPKMASDVVNQKRINAITDKVVSIIPTDNGTEDGESLILGSGHHFLLNAVYRPQPDVDETYYVNIRVKAIF